MMILRIKCIVILVLCALASMAKSGREKQLSKPPLSITVLLSDAKNTDTLVLKMSSSFCTACSNEKSIFYAGLGKNGVFTFHVPTDEAFGYWEINKLVPIPVNDTVHSMSSRFAGLTDTYYWERGDDVRINLERKRISKNLFTDRNDYDSYFTGKGALKYTIQDKAVRFINKIDDKPMFDETFTYHNVYADSYDKICSIIDSNKTNLTLSAYYVLKAEYAFSNVGRFYQFNFFNEKAKAGGAGNQFSNALKKQKSVILQPVNDIPNQYLARSNKVCQYITGGIGVMANIEQGKHISLGLGNDSVYFYIKKNYKGELRDNLIAYYLYSCQAPTNAKQVFEDALQTIKTPRLLKILQSMSYTQIPGSKAYNFSLPDTLGQLHSLSELAGKTVFVDFWFTGCGACEAFYRSALSKVEERYKENKNIIFVSISIDVKDYLWKRSIRSGKYTGAECLNLFTGGNSDQVPLIEYYHIVGYPTAMLIDKTGKIVGFNTSELYEYNSLINMIENVL